MQEILALRVAIKEGFDAATAGQVISIDELSGKAIAERARKRRRRKNAESDAAAS